MARRGVFDLIMNKEEYMQPEQRAVPIKLSDSSTQDPDELVECPYDKVHRIRVSRFPMHLLKCRKNYTGREMFTCPFNARHIIPKPEARHHIANCPDKAAIEKDMVQGYESNNTYCRGYISVPSYHKNEDYGTPTENWDEEINRTNDTEREYWGPEDGPGDERPHLPKPKGRGTPRAVGHMQPTQPEMRLPRQPAQAAAVAQQCHQQLQQQQQQSEPLPPHQNHVGTTPQPGKGPTLTQPPPSKVAGLGRGQFKGRVMAANLWGSQPQGQGQASPSAQPSPPRPGGLVQSSWADQATQNSPTTASYMDDFPPLGGTPQPRPAAPLGLGRGLGRGHLLSNPAPVPGMPNGPQ